MEFDHVIAGAGSAGATLAARLAGAGRRVLLLEAGPGEEPPLRRFLVGMPLGYGLTFSNPVLNWMYWSEPVPGLGGRRLYVPRGKMLGGSSSINAMVWIRGHAQDYADWAEAAGPAWTWAEVRRAFEALEARVGVRSTEAGAHPLCRAYLAAAAEAGLPVTGDQNAEGAEGAAYNPVNIRDGLRRSSARVFLEPRPAGLRVETNATVTAIEFEGARATGLRFRQGGVTHRARARSDVILSAGAIGTPQLLMLSGLGPAAELRALGLPVRRDLPAIGRHLRDHTAWDIYYRSRVPTINEELRPLLGRLRAGLRYVLFRSGPLALSMNHAGGFVRTEGRNRPNLQLYFCPSSYERRPSTSRRMMQPDPWPGFSLSISNTRPRSEGRIALASPDPAAAPLIQPNLLAAPEDMEEMLAGARLLRRIAAQPSLAKVIAAETKPGAEIVSEADLAAHIRAHAYSIYHPCGTARMGRDPATSAVDGALRVHGVEGLRVADASVFPDITSGNINAPAMMVGWRAADLILGR